MLQNPNDKYIFCRQRIYIIWRFEENVIILGGTISRNRILGLQQHARLCEHAATAARKKQQ